MKCKPEQVLKKHCRLEDKKIAYEWLTAQQDFGCSYLSNQNAQST